MKITLRKPKISDAKELRDLISDKDVIKEIVGYPYPCPLSRMKKDVRDCLKGWKTKDSYAFTILADGKIAGSIILENPSKDKKRYDLGAFVGKKFWNKGVATEAIKQMVKFGFNKLKLYRIQADNDSDNPGSGRALEKAGFKKEGIRKHTCKKKGKFVDLEMWGKLK